MREQELTPEDEIRYLKTRVHYWENRVVEQSRMCARLEMENFELKTKGVFGMIEEKMVWLLAALVKLARGDRVEDAADVADKFCDEYEGRFDYDQ